MDDPELRLILFETKFSYYADPMGNIYRLLKHKPRPKHSLANKLKVDGNWFLYLSQWERGRNEYYAVELVMLDGRKKLVPFIDLLQ